VFVAGQHPGDAREVHAVLVAVTTGVWARGILATAATAIRAITSDADRRRYDPR
jgi:hypothetical protein